MQWERWDTWMRAQRLLARELDPHGEPRQYFFDSLNPQHAAATQTWSEQLITRIEPPASAPSVNGPAAH